MSFTPRPHYCHWIGGCCTSQLADKINSCHRQESNSAVQSVALRHSDRAVTALKVPIHSSWMARHWVNWLLLGAVRRTSIVSWGCEWRDGVSGTQDYLLPSVLYGLHAVCPLPALWERTQLTAWNRGPVPVILQHLMEAEGSLPCSEEPLSRSSIESRLIVSSHPLVSRGSAVGIATGEGLDHRGSTLEFR
jgi:hypothetical protein